MRYQPLAIPPSPSRCSRCGRRARRLARRRARPASMASASPARPTLTVPGATAVAVPSLSETAGHRCSPRHAGAPVRVPFLVSPGQPARHPPPAFGWHRRRGARTARPSSASPRRRASRHRAGVALDPPRARAAPCPRGIRPASPPSRASPADAAGVRRSRAASRRLAALFRAAPGGPAWRAWGEGLREGAGRHPRGRLALTRRSSPSRPGCARRAPTTRTRASPTAPDALARWAGIWHSRLLPDVRRLAGRAGAPLGRSGPRGRRLRARRPANGVYHVTDRDAHAWVEAWFPGYGWLPFDATPGRCAAQLGPRRRRSRSTGVRRRRVERGTRSSGLPKPRLPLGSAAAAPQQARTVRRRDAGRARWRGAAAGIVSCSSCSSPPCCSRSARCCGSRCRGEPALAARLRIGAYAADQGLQPAKALTPRELAAALERRFGVGGRRFRERARAVGLRRAGHGRRAPRARDGRAAARAAGVARAGLAGCAARSHLAGFSAARGRAR